MTHAPLRSLGPRAACLLSLAALLPALAAAGPQPAPSGDERLAGANLYLRPFLERADRDTGLMPSFLQVPAPATELHLYDAALLMIAAPGEAGRLVRTFARQNSADAAEKRPVTAVAAGKYSPDGGWFNTVRVGDFRGDWWARFDWS